MTYIRALVEIHRSQEKIKMEFEKTQFGCGTGYKLKAGKYNDFILSKVNSYLPLLGIEKEVKDTKNDFNIDYAGKTHKFIVAIGNKSIYYTPALFLLTLIDGKRCSFFILKDRSVYLVPFGHLTSALFLEESCFEGVLQGKGSGLNAVEVFKILDCLKYKGAEMTGMLLPLRMVFAWMVVRLAYIPSSTDRVALDGETYYEPSELLKHLKTTVKSEDAVQQMNLLLRPTDVDSLKTEIELGLRMRIGLATLLPAQFSSPPPLTTNNAECALQNNLSF